MCFESPRKLANVFGLPKDLCFDHSKSISCTGVKGAKLYSILMWHYRLSHPNFTYLRKLMPQLFDNISLRQLSCEACIFAKQTKASYLPKPYEPSSPFNLIH